MIISVTLSKPVKNIEEILGRPYQRIKIRAANNSNSTSYMTELFTQKQAFHEQKSEQELNDFIEKHAGTTFKNCVIRTESEEITILGNKKGEKTRLVKKIDSTPKVQNITWNRKKNYLIQEGKAVPFLVLLGVMTPEGRVINSKYDKFRQINRFLEFLNDILPEVMKKVQDRPLRIADFGCGKSYLTFAVHYFLTEIKKIDVEITGLDLKKEVIDWCNKITGELGLKGLNFAIGNIEKYSHKNAPDIMITLHACDTATDYALDYAVKHGSTAILSVPCCQHEINQQTDKNKAEEVFRPLLKYGIIKERFSALVTDALRAEFLEKQGYSVQLLEFIDMEHTPKNILIRAVKTKEAGISGGKTDDAEKLISALQVSPTIKTLLS
ncbi:MAG: SAM-dependent methyltransferase [Treponema sp.]|nr:SAM-dependent methyltransferase [Treponema sp.]